MSTPCLMLLMMTSNAQHDIEVSTLGVKCMPITDPIFVADTAHAATVALWLSTIFDVLGSPTSCNCL